MDLHNFTKLLKTVTNLNFYLRKVEYNMIKNDFLLHTGETCLLEDSEIDLLADAIHNGFYDCNSYEYMRLFESVMCKATPIFNKMAMRYGNERVFADDIASLAGYEGFTQALVRYDITKGSFFKMFLAKVKDASICILRRNLRKKEQLTTHATSYNQTNDDDDTPISDLLTDIATPSLENTIFNSELEQVLTEYANSRDEVRANIIRSFAVSSKKNQVYHIKHLLGVTTYSSATRKQVERIKDDFVKFYNQNTLIKNS